MNCHNILEKQLRRLLVRKQNIVKEDDLVKADLKEIRLVKLPEECYLIHWTSWKLLRRVELKIF